MQRRRLTFAEESFIQVPTMETVAVACSVRGALDTALLKQAYHLLRKEFPIVGARVEQEDDGYVFVANESDEASFIRFEAQKGPWRFEDVLSPNFDLKETVSMVNVSSDGEQHRVTFFVNHAVVDGQHSIFLLNRLWSLYTELATSGSVAPRTPQRLPSAPFELMEKKYGYVAGKTPYAERFAQIRWSGSMPCAEELTGSESFVTNRLRLDQETTARLSQAGRRLGISMHGLVSGAIAVAERGNFTNLPEEEPLWLGLLTPIDFKDKLNPPLKIYEVTTLVGFSAVAVEVDTRSDIVTIGKRVIAQIKDDLADGTVQLTSVSPFPDLASRGYEPPVLISNLGVIPDFPLPAKLFHEDFRAYIHKDFSGLPTFISSFDQGATIPVLEASIYALSTFNGQLSIEVRNIPGTIKDADQKKILARIGELLVNCGSEQTRQEG
ncbi:hypothetical protein Srot_2533 [Segniliparus rotundus DSM 44985]|uniref:Phthiocerol/phthiodiolone dimycocerosyl transferase n=1 Tax=Segniliparus rotundus (strain ATCC BAA-972 / CDC 1076 / CIP 108378 / DSM 44985 / JCM 13578) TaxID=640132 RepID=D6ZBL8_SEGRD|nr:hypothetical protein Srot_2533 [Segniliparus rotundus DSM 44985]